MSISIVVGVESFSLVKDTNSIIDVTIDCGANEAANSAVLNILTDVDISAIAKCKNGEKSFITTDSVHYTLPATLTTRDNLCELNQKDGSDNFDIEVEVHYGELDGLILTKTKLVTVVCTYSDHGKDDSGQHSIRDGPQAYIEKQSIVGGSVPKAELSLSIQTVDDQDAVGSIALDRRYSLFGSYTGAQQNVGLKPVSCDAISDDGERYAVLVAGCGDGLIFDRTDGFVTTGKTFRSPYFFAFHLAHSANLNFDCNVTLCTPNCEGTSCETVCGPVTSFVIPNIQLEQCTGNNKYQDTCSFICNDGYDKSGVAISTCGADGIWTVPDIACPPKDCGNPPPGTGSTGIASSGTTYTQTADYTCNKGYVMQSGNLQISCLVTGKWDIANILVCEFKDCGAVLPSVPSAMSSGTASSGTTYKSLADYTCNTGYERQSGNIQLECLDTGKWDVANILVCEAKDCGDPPPGTESTGTASSGTTYTDTADYICNEGFVRQSGNSQIECLDTGKWDIANILVCEPKDCGVPPPGTASTGTASSGTTYTKTASYSCNPRTTRLRGAALIQCLATGNWDVSNLLYCQCVRILDVVFVLDGSPSIGARNFEGMVNKLADAMPRFNIGESAIRVGVVVFDFTIEAVIQITGDAEALASQIRALKFPDDGGTSAGVGITRAQRMLSENSRFAAPQHIVLFADGNSNPAPYSAATLAKTSGTIIHAIGITDGADMNELRIVASDPSKAKFAETWNVMEDILHEVLDGVC
ncbi:hypothetical protein LOTGIDRAFT_159256 [Lottia gigantea]|uniref:Uncharacterized protein n=1 Tax=Lottia gigantea TaxID=225164 RepID=V4C9M2_LOTGI|nr:hypothetical protein LOTGIDRAFT_159256 [Lottia gigantea]ESO98449.1 hypothetical protein LOTGIDRAFT_159256 [Lottia gigantea]